MMETGRGQKDVGNNLAAFSDKQILCDETQK